MMMKTDSHSVSGNMLIVSLIFILTVFLCEPVLSSPRKKIQAFFQGSCSPDPCDQKCIDIPGGGFVCDCNRDYKLAPNGRDCLLLYHPRVENHLPQPLEQTGNNRQVAIDDNQSAGNPPTIKKASHDAQAGGSNPPEPVELGAGLEPEEGGVVIHSLDMKSGLDPPQALYQLREGGEDQSRSRTNDIDLVYVPWDTPVTDAADDNVVAPPVVENSICEGIQCTNNGVCVFENGNVRCQCPPGFFGTYCERGSSRPSTKAADSAACEGVQCINNGSCVAEERIARCDCPLGFTGTYCEREVEVRFPRFHGNGYLALPVLRDGYKEFAIAMEFRPEAQNGLLLFSAEFDDARKDFFAITLVNGFVEFRFDCGTGSAVLVSPVQAVVGEWNQLVVARNDNKGSLQLNGADIVQGTAQGAFTRITLRQNLYIGGYSKMASIAHRIATEKSYVGCVQHLIINGYRYDFRKSGLVGDSEFGLNVGECSEGVCDKVKCLNGGTCHAKTPDTHVCLCPLGFHGHMCEEETAVRIPHFNGHSHLEFQGLGRSVLAFTQLETVVKPETADGVILYNGYTHDRKGDFLSLALRHGYVEFSFDLGTGPAIIRSASPLKLHQWHVIRASRTGLEGALQVDEGPEVKGQSQGAYTQLTLLQNLFLGGHQNFDHTSKHANLSSSFIGCIQKVVINGHPLAIMQDWVGGRNVEPCQHPCAGEPCLNGGQCHADGEVYHCSCPIGFTHSNCEHKMDRLPTKPMFSGSSFLTYTDMNIVKRVAGSKMDLQLYLKPRGGDGLLFWSSQELLWSGLHHSNRNFDYLALAFTHGSLQLRFNLGCGEAMIAYNDSRLFDGHWHFVRIQRDNQDAYMEVDFRDIVEGSSPGECTMLNTNRIVYLGGVPDIAKTTGQRFSTSYQGCVKDVLLATDLRVKLLTMAHSGQNVEQCRKRL